MHVSNVNKMGNGASAERDILIESIMQAEANSNGGQLMGVKPFSGPALMAGLLQTQRR
jgi:hypothetical protein